MAELDELVRREENLLEATRETQEQDSEQMKSDQTDKQIGRQEQEQKNVAEKMKELGMDYEYIEVKGGGHVLIAFENLPKIFEFFNKHKRSD